MGSNSKFPESGRFPRRDDVSCGPIPEVKKYNQNWGLQPGESGSDDLSANKLNHPVPLRKGDAADNGWENEAFDVNHDKDVD